MAKVIITGSSGLIGSECVLHFCGRDWEVHGIDNNMRSEFFGPDGDTEWNRCCVMQEAQQFYHHDIDIRDSNRINELFKAIAPDLVIHCAAQPSHDLAARLPRVDFDVNAVGTMVLLEATRLFCPGAVFCFASTNKVYGDSTNELPLVELSTRWVFATSELQVGIDESMRIDEAMHSIFGASKVAADIMVQEYGRYYGLLTSCFRLSCVTGRRHSAAELHGFLGYLAKCVREGRKYRVYGYKGKQVRDIIHAVDVCAAFEQFFENPSPGAVFNLGGGPDNSISVLEAIESLQMSVGRSLEWEYIKEPRPGDHICYISNCSKFKSFFPEWHIARPLKDILKELS